jgi:hypothetical protein
MFENPAKGWHGSYSIVGRSSAEKYHLILIKDLILSGKYKKKQIKNYFSVNETVPIKKLKKEDKVDIFDEPSRDKVEKIHDYTSKRRKICEPFAPYRVPERYKFHQNHHKELDNYNTILKQSKKYTPGSGNYNPKMDYIWKKTITGPTWDIMSGREKKVVKLKNDVDKVNTKVRNKRRNKIEITEIEKNNNKNTLNIETMRKNKYDLFSNKKMNSIICQKIYGISMEKQTQRGNLPISYDLRIRNDRPFQARDNSRDISKEKIYKNESNDIIKYDKIRNKYDSEESKNLKKTKVKNYIDFSKKLSREQYDNLFKDKEVVPFTIPNYSQVEPRCLTMVSYTSKINKKKIKKKLKGIDNTLFYNPDKIINKVNNHKEVSVPNFKIMVSRPDDQGPLPSYMIKKFDRASLETITQKGLKMNGYANVGFKTYSSSFYPKKSFNKIINYNLLNSDKFVDSNLDGLLEKMNNNKHIRKLVELYSICNEDNFDTNYPKFDAITFRTIHNERQKRAKNI